jgi:small-conductance mechanosensitive channel
MENTREQKAKIFDSLLLEHDKYSRELSQLKSNFNLTKDDEKKIKELQQKMDGVQRKAASLGN